MADEDLDRQTGPEQPLPGWAHVVYIDGVRTSRHSTRQGAMEAHGCCTWAYSADGIICNPGLDDEYLIRLERNVRWPIWIAGQGARCLLWVWGKVNPRMRR